VPQALRDRLATPDRVEQSVVGTTLNCRYNGKRFGSGILVGVDCARNAQRRLDKHRDAQKGFGRYQGEIDIGKGGFKEAGGEMSFLDPQTECLVKVAGGDEAAARAIEAAITAETIR